MCPPRPFTFARALYGLVSSINHRTQSHIKCDKGAIFFVVNNLQESTKDKLHLKLLVCMARPPDEKKKRLQLPRDRIHKDLSEIKHDIRYGTKRIVSITSVSRASGELAPEYAELMFSRRLQNNE